jgi:uncharacterized protein (UPF0332 family)
MAATPFDWSNYLGLAVELGNSTDEASLRSVISRAYYCVYHLALARAMANEFNVRPGEATHAQLWRVFNTSPVPECQRLGTIAARLKEKRERADYENYFARVAEEVPGLLADAKEFAERLNRLPSRYPNPKSMRQ